MIPLEPGQSDALDRLLENIGPAQPVTPEDLKAAGFRYVDDMGRLQVWESGGKELLYDDQREEIAGHDSGYPLDR